MIGITSTKSSSLAISPESGELAYAAGSIIILYNPKSNKQSRYLLTKTNKSINCLSFSSCGKYLCAGESSCRFPLIYIWDLSQRASEASPDPHPHAYSQDSTQRAVLNTGPRLLQKGHKFSVNLVQFSQRSSYVLSVGDQNELKLNLWDFITGNKLVSARFKSQIRDLCFFDDSSFVSVASACVKFWTIQSQSVHNVRSEIQDQFEKEKEKEEKIEIALKSKNADLVKMKEKVFVAVQVSGNRVFLLTEDGILCVVNQNKQLEKWMELKVIPKYIYLFSLLF